MKLNSKLFDSIRVKPRHAERAAPEVQSCAWEGCDKPGLHKAPKGWRSAGEFHTFCLEHVRHYNQGFDYYAGANKDKLDEILRESAKTGERPTWSVGSNPKANAKPRPSAKPAAGFAGRRLGDPLNVFARFNRFQGKANPVTEKERRIAELDRRALETLTLEGNPDSTAIKKAYKSLVKAHHPDANGGSKASEDRLRAVIAAYTHLKKKGFV